MQRLKGSALEKRMRWAAADQKICGPIFAKIYYPGRLPAEDVKLSTLAEVSWVKKRIQFYSFIVYLAVDDVYL